MSKRGARRLDPEFRYDGTNICRATVFDYLDSIGIGNHACVVKSRQHFDYVISVQFEGEEMLADQNVRLMSKNIVICCDGAANEFTAHNTNVLKLFYMLDQDAQQQVTYYHPGLGTMEPSGALTPITRKITKGLGMALGYGLADDITRAYSFLMEEYSEGDRLFLFGFSRGAYTVRAVCSLLHMYGLIRPLNESLVPYAIRMMLAIDRARPGNSKEDDAKRQYFDLANSFKDTKSRRALSKIPSIG